jgi:hypothetical protein
MVGFNRRLQHRGTDFHAYANTGYKTDEADSHLLQQLFSDLFTDDSGIEQITVSAFTIVIKHSRAVTVKDIKSRVNTTLISFDPVFAEVC